MRAFGKSSAILLAGLLAVPLPVRGAVAQQPPALTYLQPLAPPAVRAVQDRLRQLGLYGGAVDGVWGSDSAAALERFQQSRGLQVNGQLNQATVALIGLNPSDLLASGQPFVPSSNALPPVATGETLTPAGVRAIQSRLQHLGYYTGPEDGVWGPATQDAIQRFQQGQGLQATGQLNPATVAVLGLDPNVLVSRAR